MLVNDDSIVTVAKALPFGNSLR